MAATFPPSSLRPASSVQGLAIKVEDLRKRYGEIVAVYGISFNVRENEIFGMLGPNGAGKTTTVEILEGLRTADEGRAIVAGVDVRRYPGRGESLIGVGHHTVPFLER